MFFEVVRIMQKFSVIKCLLSLILPMYDRNTDFKVYWAFSSSHCLDKKQTDPYRSDQQYPNIANILWMYLKKSYSISMKMCLWAESMVQVTTIIWMLHKATSPTSLGVCIVFLSFAEKEKCKSKENIFPQACLCFSIQRPCWKLFLASHRLILQSLVC